MEFRLKNFLKTAIVLIMVLGFTVMVIGYGIYYLWSKYGVQILPGIGAAALIIIGTLFYCLYAVVKIYKNKHITKSQRWIMKMFTETLYPLLNLTAKILKINKEELKLFIIDLNNIWVNSVKYKVKPKDILVLTPHCLQDSGCQIKITNNPNNCKHCGKCNISDLLKLCQKYGVDFYIASGGTFARKVIEETKPKYIISVACERDLLSGIMDVRKIPVIGIVNERPNGPCNNTKVDISKVEEAIINIIE